MGALAGDRENALVHQPGGSRLRSEQTGTLHDGGGDGDNELAVGGMDGQDSQYAIEQSEAGPVDRPANMIETGKDSYRFNRSLQRENGQGGKARLGITGVVMEQGWGLREWKEPMIRFRAAGRKAAFERALELGRQGQQRGKGDGWASDWPGLPGWMTFPTANRPSWE